MNDFQVNIDKYFAKICNINRADREVDIANSSKIMFQSIPGNLSITVLSHRLLIAITNHHFNEKL